MREGLRRLLPDGYTVECEAATAREALRLLRETPCDPALALIDYGLPDFTGIELTQQLLAIKPGLRVMLLSAYDDAEIVSDAIRAGVCAFVKKTESAAVLLDALDTIAKGGSYLSATATDKLMERVRMASNGGLKQQAVVKRLSPRELQVLRLIATGLQTKEIAVKLNLSHETVKTHRKNVMKRLGVTNAAKLMTVAMQQRLISIAGDWRD
jgi:DNA-binding NarL/FixJ family response regulator